MINEYFGVSVVSEPWMASAGVEPLDGFIDGSTLTPKYDMHKTYVSALAKSKVAETLGACRP